MGLDDISDLGGSSWGYGVSYLWLCVQWRILVLVRRLRGEEVSQR
jgi:hypothetical protein